MKGKSGKNMNGLRVGRIVVNLNREEFEFVDKIGRDALFTTGKRLTNNKIIRTFVNVIMQIAGIDGKGLHSCEELKNRILFALDKIRERRKYPRFRKEVQISWRRLDSMDQHEEGKSIEISEGGFRIELDKKVGIGEMLEFIIAEPTQPDNPIKAFGRIAWVKKRRDSLFDAGIQLTYLSEKDRDRFNELFLCPSGLPLDIEGKRWYTLY